MTIEEFLAVVKALGLDMSTPLADAMAKIKDEPAEEKPAEDAPAEAVAAAEPPAAAPAKEEDKPAEVAAALSAICSLSGKGFVASVADIRTWHASHVELATERKKLAEREAVLENAERIKLCRELVTLAGKKPAVVWADPLASSPVPKPYLLAMPIADLRAMHADEIKACGGKPSTAKPPVTKTLSTNAESVDGKIFNTPFGSVPVSARELKFCAEEKADLQVYANNKAFQIQAREGVK